MKQCSFSGRFCEISFIRVTDHNGLIHILRPDLRVGWHSGVVVSTVASQQEGMGTKSMAKSDDP